MKAKRTLETNTRHESKRRSVPLQKRLLCARNSEHSVVSRRRTRPGSDSSRRQCALRASAHSERTPPPLDAANREARLGACGSPMPPGTLHYTYTAHIRIAYDITYVVYMKTISGG